MMSEGILLIAAIGGAVAGADLHRIKVHELSAL